MQDTLFAVAQDEIARFCFDEKVAGCFSDMIYRSVPGYGQMLGMLPILVAPLVKQATYPVRIYDLGTSLGACSLALCQAFAPDTLEICAVDVSAPMLERARTNFATHCPNHKVDTLLADIADVQFAPCQVVILNLTLQFLPVEARFLVLKRAFDALTTGAILILSEKVHYADATYQDTLTGLHYEFKRQNGYSELEIAQKRDALLDVLRTDTLEMHHARLKKAGFGQVVTWCQFLQFASMVAVKA